MDATAKIARALAEQHTPLVRQQWERLLVTRAHGPLVLDGVSFRIAPGEKVAFVGASGGGKTTLVQILLGLYLPEQGEVYFDGTRVDTLAEPELVGIRKRIGYLFQLGALFDSMNILDNVGFPLREQGENDQGVIESRALEALEVVGLREHAGKMPINLSGGMRKRVALARAVISATPSASGTAVH